jgi:hypothetical protein
VPEASAESGTYLARPKSNTFTRRSPVTMTFPGFTSRWTTPRLWASAKASATWAAISSISGTPGWRARTYSPSVCPGTYSIAMNPWAPSSPWSSPIS